MSKPTRLKSSAAATTTTTIAATYRLVFPPRDLDLLTPK